jgi:hypothetical protein
MYNLPLKIKATERTPSLEYDPKGPTFNMIGISVPDDAKSFYAPILQWVEKYSKEGVTNPMIINIDLDYFSIQSASALLKIIKYFDILPNVTLNWYFDDKDTEEIGQDLASMVKMKFNHINKNPDYYKDSEII